MHEVARHRLFFALWPDAEIASHLYALGADLVAHTSGRGRVMRAESLHMTLAFVGSVTSIQRDALIESANGIQCGAFDVSLDRLGFWPRGGVLYAGSSASGGTMPCRQRRLFDAVRALILQSNLPHDGRLQVPHVTLARNVRGPDLPRLGAPLSWHANEFALVESQLHSSGARYKTLATWPLHCSPGDED
jgi:2'-5' RNA ligase